jgi:hypothetical protein
MNKKLLVLIFIGIFLVSFISAFEKEVIYIVTNDPEPAFLIAMDDLGLSYDVIYHTDVDEFFDFSSYKMILVNDDYFPNWDLIPINEKPSLVANKDNIHNWGWAVRATEISSSGGIYVDADNSTEFTQNFPNNFKTYTSNYPNIYQLDKYDIFNGFEKLVYSTFDEGDIVVGVINAGTTLSKIGYQDTFVNANSAFFGITESEHWSVESNQLFKNLLLWLTAEQPVDFSIDFSQGNNLVSFPLEMDTNQILDILNNENISQILEYDNAGGFVQATTIVPGEGYFVNVTGNFSLEISGLEPQGNQAVSLDQGMNLVGLKSISNKALVDLPIEAIEVSSRRMDARYETATSYSFGWYNPDSILLEPGKGYWLKVNQTGVVWNYAS